MHQNLDTSGNIDSHHQSPQLAPAKSDELIADPLRETNQFPIDDEIEDNENDNNNEIKHSPEQNSNKLFLDEETKHLDGNTNDDFEADSNSDFDGNTSNFGVVKCDFAGTHGAFEGANANFTLGMLVGNNLMNGLDSYTTPVLNNNPSRTSSYDCI